MRLHLSVLAGLTMFSMTMFSMTVSAMPDVRVNGISPGPIEGTEGMARLAPDASTKQKHFDRIAMKRWGFVDEIAEGAVFLSSDAAKYITGAILDIDGGSSLGDATQRSTDKGLA